MRWSQALLKKCVNGEDVPPFITILPAGTGAGNPRYSTSTGLPSLSEAVALSRANEAAGLCGSGAATAAAQRIAMKSAAWSVVLSKRVAKTIELSDSPSKKQKCVDIDREVLATMELDAMVENEVGAVQQGYQETG